MYQSTITIGKDGRYGLWIDGYGMIWFKTLAEAQDAYAENPIL